MKRLLVALALIVMATPLLAADWSAILAAARGQTVYFNTWGGDERTNRFIEWAGQELERQFGVKVVQVKLADTAEAVTRVVAEKAAGQATDGSVDLVWINGPNFQSMKEQGLLYGPFLQDLPNARYLDLAPGAPASVDFTLPTDGYESPWRLAKFVLTYDSARVDTPPQSMVALADWARANPGRMTHPSPSNFLGATFLKQALLELAPDPSVLKAPVTDATFAAQTAPLWQWYDRLRPSLWHQGQSFPENESILQQMLNDREVDFAMAFDPAAAAAAVEQGLLPDSVRSYGFNTGTIGNVSFVAIPFNTAHKEGAMVLANFLLDPATQAHAQDIRVMGSYTVLDMNRLDPGQKAAFTTLPSSPSLPASDALGPTLTEPHPSWMLRLTEEWAKRYTP